MSVDPVSVILLTLGAIALAAIKAAITVLVLAAPIRKEREAPAAGGRPPLPGSSRTIGNSHGRQRWRIVRMYHFVGTCARLVKSKFGESTDQSSTMSLPLAFAPSSIRLCGASVVASRRRTTLWPFCAA